MIVNETLAIFLVNKSCRAILVTFEKGTEKTTAPMTMFKTFDQDIKAKDLVVVPTGNGHGFAIARVEQVDAAVDYDSSTPIKWIAGRVDIHGYEIQLSREGDMLKKVRDAKEHAKREELKKIMFEHADAQELEKLSIVQMTDLKGLPPAPDAATE